jgi:hypothetical protein
MLGDALELRLGQVTALRAILQASAKPVDL